LALGIEREKVFKEREERLRAKREDELAKMYQLAKEGIVKQPVEMDSLVNNSDIESDSDSDSISNDSDDQSISIEPLSDNDVAPGELITDWDRIEADDIMLDSKHEKGSHVWSKDYIWQHGERLVQYLELVHLVTVETILAGELVLTTHSLYFRQNEDPISVMTKEAVNATNRSNSSGSLEERRWRLNRLTEVHERRYMLRTQALELFFADTHELFINFCGGVKVRDKFVDKLRQCKTPLLTLPRNLSPKAVFKTRFTGLTQQWQQRKISNFEYLMQLNIIAGRTYNDVSQYPVFPWIIADYSSDELDLNDPKSFRDLTKPVGALNPDRLLQLLERYHDLDGLPEEERFLYGSHYSSPGAVLHFLIRQEPFTTMAIELQSGRFDCPDRQFYDIAACWHSCLQSTSDVKELVPELFTCPEILVNTNNFPLGETQTKKSISNVKLPPWANGSPHEFVRLNRLALESEYVSCNLHHWIDLIFGFQQRGLDSVKANNVFHFVSYEGSVNLDKITDELDRKATESQIQNFGQTPSQILTISHPHRFPAKKCWKPIISELSPTRRLMCYTPFKQFGGNRSMNKHGPAVSIQLLTDHVVVVYADLSVGTYKWAPTKHGKMPFYLKMSNIRPVSSREMSISKFAMGVQTSPEKSSRSTSHNERASIGIGNWSFAMTMSSGNKSKYETSKTKMGKLNKSKEISSSYIDATLISCGYWDNALKAHSLDGLRLKCSETGGHLGAINCLRLGEDGTLLITGGVDGTCRVWTAENSDMGSALIDSYVKTAQEKSSNCILMCCLVLWGHGSPISSLAFDTDLDIVVSGSIDGTICIHTVLRGQFIRSLQVADFFPPANIFATKSDDVATRSVRKLAIHKDGIFVAHLETGLLQMYTINGTKLGCIDAGEKLHAMEMIPGGHSLVTGGESGHVIIRSLRNLGIRYVLDLSDYGPIHCITFTPPPLHSKSIQQFMFVGTQDGSITVACAQREDGADDEEEDTPSSAQYTQHQALKRKETKSWWR
jgi:WD40 repeat protein